MVRDSLVRDSLVRVAAYCRVSTDKDDQVNSLESQKRYFAEYIRRNPMWELVEVYADEGVTGTSTAKRREFNRMIDDASEHMFELIITKEISRFARNTLDSIFYTRKLKDWGVGVIFMNDNINTLDPDAELRLTIMSSIAQEESRKTSDRVKWGQKRRMEQGVVFGRNLLGFDVKNGKLSVNEEGARIVRLIFHKFLFENKGTHVIARELREAGITTTTNMCEWSNTAILRILKNEKYCGDLVQKKTYTPNYLTHRKKYNTGQEETVVIKDHHDAIISRDIFEKTAKELERRSSLSKKQNKFTGKYCFSGKIKCGICGKTYVPLTKTRHDGSVYKAWRCSENAKNGNLHVDAAGNHVGCGNISVNDEALKMMLMHIMKILYECDKSTADKFIGMTENTYRTDTLNDSANEKIKALSQKRLSLIELYINGEIEKGDFKTLLTKYDAQIAEVNTKNKFKDQRCVTDNIKNFISGIFSGDIWNEVFYGNILNSITVTDGGITVKFCFSDELYFVYN